MKKIRNISFIFILALSLITFVSCSLVIDKKENIDDSVTEKYKITLNNKVESEDITINVRYLVDEEGTLIPQDIEFGKEYEKGITIFVQVLNDSNKKLVVKALAGSEELDYSVIAAKKDDLQGAGGLFGLELNQNITIEVDEVTTAKITITEDTSANTAFEQNKVHVYNPDDLNLAEYSDGQEVPLGNKVTIYEFNYATAVHLTITHDGKLYKDVYYSKITDFYNGHGEFFDFVLEGDLEVVVENVSELPKDNFVSVSVEGDREIAYAYVGDIDFHTGDSLAKGTYNITIYSELTNKAVHAVIKVGDKLIAEVDVIQYKTISEVVVDDKLSFIFTESDVEVELENYVLTIDNKVSDLDVTFNVMTVETVDGTPTVKVLESGKEYVEGTLIYVQVLNRSNETLKVSATINGKEVDSMIIAKKPDDEDDSAGGLFGISLDGDMKIVLETVSQEVEYNVSVTNETGESIQAFYGEDFTDFEDGTKIKTGTYDISLSASYPENALTITLKINGTVITVLNIDEYDENSVDLENILVDGDVEILVTLTDDNKVLNESYNGKYIATEGEKSLWSSLDTYVLILGDDSSLSVSYEYEEESYNETNTFTLTYLKYDSLNDAYLYTISGKEYNLVVTIVDDNTLHISDTRQTQSLRYNIDLEKVVD